MSSGFNQWTGPSGLVYYDEADVKWLFSFFRDTVGLSQNALQGLFGNIYHESFMCPFLGEGWENISRYSYEWQWNYCVNNVRTLTADQYARQWYGASYYKGYSLAQWTTTDRKKQHYNYDAGGTKPSWKGLIGDMERDGNFLLLDLQTWDMRSSANESIWSAQNKTVWQWLSDPNVSISDAINAVLMIYERPFQDAAEAARNYQAEYNSRERYSRFVMQDLAGITPQPTPPTPGPPDPPPEPPTPGSLGLPIWLYFKMKEMNENGK